MLMIPIPINFVAGILCTMQIIVNIAPHGFRHDTDELFTAGS
ncbi:hypothetical protein SAMN05660226_02142 [Parapedobacter luteus]|uniref:Uncharacterized protein n=1 Tax=Parapedobacter luteus TaxID=623280 RepID=A0A1T5CEB3_9SPHI|nr:hypothetical protein SAMN05660226_02142 [Parapedobacter luteus]